ncbi:hypothetical protein [Caulobacter sp. NIBR1757]|uniref:hypothetical protein n=1 Tax=Caulobacter sp. NIBR1757 TaxID=3016000 RepID=UPI0022F0127F|nr:hypothetical protein [Caulobacter sp. NIBR1757]WGM37322.1 hypothetical protein AMEJIAPC_00219 [Caulobacter sp. NIBR1757]
MRQAFVLAAVMALLAGPVLAQQQPASSDPIGDVLSGLAAAEGMDDDAAESPTATAPDAAAASQANSESADGDAEDPGAGAALPAPAPPSAYSPPAPYTPIAPTSRLPQLDRPVMIDELSRTPEAPPTQVEQAYESRVRGGLNAAQGLQGPLDGGWVVRGTDGRTLYGLQLVDKGTGAVTLEGAWRSLKQGQPAGQVGLVDVIERTAAGGVYIRFLPRGAQDPSILQLDPAGGGWNGTLWEAGNTRSVTLRRQ